MYIYIYNQLTLGQWQEDKLPKIKISLKIPKLPQGGLIIAQA